MIKFMFPGGVEGVSYSFSLTGANGLGNLTEESGCSSFSKRVSKFIIGESNKTRDILVV